MNDKAEKRRHLWVILYVILSQNSTVNYVTSCFVSASCLPGEAAFPWWEKLYCSLLHPLHSRQSSLVAQRLKCLPPMRETWVRSLGRRDPLEKEMVTHSSICAWRIPWTEKPGRLQATGHGVPKSQTQLSNFTFTFSFSTAGPLYIGFPFILCYPHASAPR